MGKIGLDYKKKIITMIAFIVFIGMALLYKMTEGSFQPVQIAKYPPRIYYMAYGILISFALLHYAEKHVLKIYDNVIIGFISRHSM